MSTWAMIRTAARSPEIGDDGGERPADEVERAGIKRGRGVAARVVGVERRWAAHGVEQRAPQGTQHEAAERVGMLGGHHAETVGRDTGRRERAMVAAEDGDAADHVIALVAAEAAALERARYQSQ